VSTTARSSQVIPSSAKKVRYFAAKLFGSAAILTIAIAFVLRYVFRYYLNYNRELQSQLLGHARLALDAHDWRDAGLASGPWQFWSGFRTRYVRLHRWTGRVFLAGVAVGCLGAFRTAVNTTFGWA
jgi:hypothetical protein